MAKAKKSEPAIEIRNISKEFVLPQYQNDSLKQLIVHGFRRNKKTRRTVLNDISFTINKGDFFGIVGRNGSGKSTLLKLICGIYTPTSGEIITHGKITPFIELGVGFNPELSGRDNVYLNGALLGFSRKEMHEMYDDIVEFAELEEFMDLKLKNYSSGMQVRLAFSIAIKSKSPILVFDEVLAVGDASFQAKCLRQFAEFKKSGRTIVLVTHDMNTVEKFCDRVVLLNDSLVAYDGGFAKAIELYNSLNVLGSSDDNEIDKHSKSPAWIKSVTVNSKKNSPKGVVEPLVPFSISIQIQASKEIKSAFLAVKVCESESQKIVFGFDSKADNHKLPLKLGNNKVVIDIDKSTFVSGKYYVVAGLYNNSGREIIYSHYNGLERGSMFMVGSGLDDGLISVDHTWRSK